MEKQNKYNPSEYVPSKSIQDFKYDIILISIPLLLITSVLISYTVPTIGLQIAISFSSIMSIIIIFYGLFYNLLK